MKTERVTSEQFESIAQRVLDEISESGSITLKTIGGHITVAHVAETIEGTEISVESFVFTGGGRRHSISASPQHTDLSRFAAHLEGFIEFGNKGAKPAGRRVTKISSVGTSRCHLVSGNVTLVIGKMRATHEPWYEQTSYHQDIEVYVDGVHLCDSWLDRKPTKNPLKNPPVQFVGFAGVAEVEDRGLTSFSWDDMFDGGKHGGIKRLVAAARRLSYTDTSKWVW